MASLVGAPCTMGGIGHQELSSVTKSQLPEGESSEWNVAAVISMQVNLWVLGRAETCK